MSEEDNADLLQRLQDLRIEHRDLDDVIARLAASVDLDQLQLRRLKKRKLYLKDTISKLESKLIPDLDA
ncbi:MAG: YdcH family protein [Gammaproteobacteria bacterium]